MRALGVIASCLLLFSSCVPLGGRSASSAPNVPSTGSASAASFPSEWNITKTEGGPGFRSFDCEFRVPSVPAFRGQAIYLWCGVQQASGVNEKKDFGVLQPVLMFGPDCVQDLPEGMNFGPDNDSTYVRNPYWYYSAQYVYPHPTDPDDYQCTTGKIFKARAGEALVSRITYDSAMDAMTVRISAANGSKSSSLTVKHPKDDSRKSWNDFMGRSEILLEGVLEIPHPDPGHPMPKEILRGWRLKAKVMPAPQFPFMGDGPWKLEPDKENSLSIECIHSSKSLESDCLWRR